MPDFKAKQILQETIEKKLISTPEVIFIKKAQIKKNGTAFYISSKKDLKDVKQLKEFRDTVEEKISLGESDIKRLTNVDDLTVVGEISYLHKTGAITVYVYPSHKIAGLFLKSNEKIPEMSEKQIRSILHEFNFKRSE